MTSLVVRLRNLLDTFRQFPLHPQWLIFRHERALRAVVHQMDGLILDIGCGKMRIKSAICRKSQQYIGLDLLQTARDWYRTTPNVYGSAESLPFRSGTAKHVLLLNVIEHLEDVEACIQEVARVLTPGGTCLIEVPFLYPIHDSPRDYRRWTENAFPLLAARYSLDISSITALGRPLETLAVLFNVALAKPFLDLLGKGSPLIVLAFAAFPLILISNLLGFLLAPVLPGNFMPHGYRVVLKKSLSG